MIARIGRVATPDNTESLARRSTNNPRNRTWIDVLLPKDVSDIYATNVFENELRIGEVIFEAAG